MLFKDAIWNYPEYYYDTNFHEIITHDSILNSGQQSFKKELGIANSNLRLERIKFISDKREKIITTLIAFLAFILTIWRSYEYYRQNQINTEKNTQEKLKDKNNLLLQQFSKAADLLKDNDISARLSGIYLFEKIMNESQEYHWQVIEILTAFVREKRNNSLFIVNEQNQSKMNTKMEKYAQGKLINLFVRMQIVAGLPPEITEYFFVPIENDIQSIIKVLGRRNIKYEIDEISGDNLHDLIEEFELNNNDKKIEILKKINRIKKIDLSNTNLNMSSWDNGLNESFFNNIDLKYSHLSQSILTNSNFIGSIFENAYFNSVVFKMSNFSGCNFHEAEFCKTDFSYGIFEYSKFNECTFQEFKMVEAKFDFSELRELHFHHDANIPSEVFSHASLSKVEGLNSKFVTEVKEYKPTVFD